MHLHIVCSPGISFSFSLLSGAVSVHYLYLSTYDRILGGLARDRTSPSPDRWSLASADAEQPPMFRQCSAGPRLPTAIVRTPTPHTRSLKWDLGPYCKTYSRGNMSAHPLILPNIAYNGSLQPSVRYGLGIIMTRPRVTSISSTALRRRPHHDPSPQINHQLFCT